MGGGGFGHALEACNFLYLPVSGAVGAVGAVGAGGFGHALEACSNKNFLSTSEWSDGNGAGVGV